MKKLTFLVYVLIGNIFSPSLFGMQRLFITRPQVYPLQQRRIFTIPPKIDPKSQQRNYAKKVSQDKYDDGEIDGNDNNVTIRGNGNNVNDNIFYNNTIITGGDYVRGNKVSGDCIKNEYVGDFSGRDTIKKGWFARVNTGFSPTNMVKKLYRRLTSCGKTVKNIEENITIENIQIATNNLPNKLITKKMDLPGLVQGVDFSGVGKCTITQCPKACPNKAACTDCQQTLTLTAPKNVMPHLVQDLTNECLTIGVKNNTSFHTSDSIHYHIKLKEGIKKLFAAGAVEIDSNNIKAPHLELNLSGATKFTAPIQVDTLEAGIFGSSKVTLGGTATEQEIVIAGAAEYNAKKLTCQDATIKSSGAALALVGRIIKKFSYYANGASTILFSGNPITSGKISGAAKVKKS